MTFSFDLDGVSTAQKDYDVIDSNFIIANYNSLGAIGARRA